MNNSNMSHNRPNEYLGVNKIGKNIRKSPLYQPNFANSSGTNNKAPARQQPQPQVYNISKSDFRSIVQQLTGSPSRQDPLPRPPNNPPNHRNMRLQRIRPPPLTPINRPLIPPVVAGPPPVPPPPQGFPVASAQVPFSNSFVRQLPHPGQPSPRGLQSLGPRPSDAAWTSPVLSPISAYMQQLQSCIGDGGSMLVQPQLHPQVPGPNQAQPPSQLPSPRLNSPALLPSPTSQFLLPSPSGFFNLSSPALRSPYPLLSPGSRFPPPLSPNFGFSPIVQSGILGSGPQPPISPGIVFPLSPSGFFPSSSPR